MMRLPDWLYSLINRFNKIKRQLFNWIIKSLSTGGVLAIVILVGLSFVSIKDLRSVKSLSEKFENDNLRVGIVYHEFAAPGESGDIEVVVENVGQDSYKDVRINIIDGEHVWFMQGNESFIPQLKRGEQEHLTLHYIIIPSLPKSVDHLDLRVFVEYTMSGNSPDSMAGTSTKNVEFSDPPEIRFIPYVSLFFALNNTEVENPNELSGLTSFFGAMVGLTGVILTLRTNFQQIGEWFASKKREKETKNN